MNKHRTFRFHVNGADWYVRFYKDGRCVVMKGDGDEPVIGTWHTERLTTKRGLVSLNPMAISYVGVSNDGTEYESRYKMVLAKLLLDEYLEATAPSENKAQ